MADPTEIELLANRVTEVVLRDLNDRRGIKQVLQSIGDEDDEILAELLVELRDKIAECLRTRTPSESDELLGQVVRAIVNDGRTFMIYPSTDDGVWATWHDGVGFTSSVGLDEMQELLRALLGPAPDEENG